jgi:hypothetical protein
VCADPPVVTTTQPEFPADVCIPQGFGSNPIAFFDDYSWRTFIAAVWPTVAGQRGVPDSAKKVGDTSAPLVFETFKQDWEIFLPDGAAPAPAWNAFSKVNPCKLPSTGAGDFLLASFSEFGNLGEAGFGDLTHALPAQNKTWVRYSTGFNKSEFDTIVSGRLYLRAQLPANGVTFQNGAIDVKSSWIDMANIPHPERYYTRKAWVKDPVTGSCSSAPITVGLVGLHIVQKSPSRPQWIWSTFEQIDNIPSTAGSPSAFTDGTATPMPASDPNGGFPPTSWANPVVYNVQRIKPINPSTQATNIKYQQAVGGVWKFYQLVLTQWPLQLNPPAPIPPSQTGVPANTFPGKGATSAFTNATLETWDQRTINTGCMNCHTSAQQATDFLWTLQVNAFPPLAPLNAFSVPQSPSSAVKTLKTLLNTAKPLNEPKKIKH